MKVQATETEPSKPGRIIQINGSNVHLYCVGKGGPTVVLEAGLGGNSLEWQPVQNILARSVRVCSYDRPGYGWSDMAASPRNATTIARELEQILKTAGEARPYVLVGHSFGGFVVRLFASRYAAETAGIVLVDASHEGMFRMLGGNASTMLVTAKSPQSYRPVTPQNLPWKQKQAHKILSRLPRTHITIQNENYYFRRSAEEIKRSAKLPDVPVTVISRGFDPQSADRKSARIANRWHDLQVDLHRRLGTGNHVIAKHSGHFPHLDQPRLIAEAVLRMTRKLNQTPTQPVHPPE